MKSEGYTIGVDFGTLSGRAVVVRVSDGTELGSAVFDYPHAVMDQTLHLERRDITSRMGIARPAGLSRGLQADDS